jgi:purine-binding chemotaxis protein CheW
LPVEPGEVPGATPAALAADVAVPGVVRARRACVVSVGGRTLAVDVHEAREVTMLEALTPVPAAPSPLLGVANLRGSVLAVADARPTLGLPPRALEAGAPAIVLAAGGLEAAIPIDGVLGLEWFDAPLPPDDLADAALAPFAAGVLPRNGDPAILLDAARLLEALRAPWAPSGPEA